MSLKLFARAAALRDERRRLERLPGGGPATGVTPARDELLAAVLRRNATDIARLISAGADVNAADADHTTPLALAVVMGDRASVALLLKNGARVDAADEEGVTPLLIATTLWRNEIAGDLITAGARVNGTAADGATPLLASIRGFAQIGADAFSRRVDLVRELIARGADANISDWSGTTPLIEAAGGNAADSRLVPILIAAGARIDAADRNRRTALIAAVERRSVDAVRALLAAGANVNAADEHGTTPLMRVAATSYPEGMAMTGLMLAAGADVNAKSTDGVTALLRASGQIGPDDPAMVERLLDAGACVDAADESGRTPLMAAAENGHVQQLRALLRYGADARLKDKRGRTALDYARPKRGQNDSGPHCYEWATKEAPSDCAASRDLLQSTMSRTSGRGGQRRTDDLNRGAKR